MIEASIEITKVFIMVCKYGILYTQLDGGETCEPRGILPQGIGKIIQTKMALRQQFLSVKNIQEKKNLKGGEKCREVEKPLLEWFLVKREKNISGGMIEFLPTLDKPQQN